MRGAGPVRLALAAVLLSGGCTTPTSFNFERRTQEGLAAQVMAQVCLPFVADGVDYHTVRSRLDFAWGEDPPELLTSGPPGPVFRQGFLVDDAVLSFTPGHATRLPEWQGMRDCRLVLKRSTPAAIRAVIEEVMAARPDFTSGRPVQREIAKYCARPEGGPAVRLHVMDAGTSGVIVGVSQSRSPMDGCE
ncbi:MAG TPA: hypothetical protein VGE54_02900 [Brevundimonas sp.]